MEEDQPQGDILEGLGAVVVVLAAIAVAAAAGVGVAILNPGKEAAVTAALAQEVHERACIAQYGPSERFKKPEVCALGTRDVPADVLSYPLAKR